MKIAVFGLGYVGSVTAAVFAREGNEVTGVDTDARKVELMSRGEPTILEQGLPELLEKVASSGRLSATTDARHALDGVDVVFVCVGTPSAANGSLDVSHLKAVAEEIGAGIAEHGGYPVVVLRSTVLPDVVEELVIPALESGSGKQAGKGFGLAVNPEFLREGTSLRDFDNPQYTLVGADDQRTVDALRALYGFVASPFLETDRRTASIVKYACNAFHAVKVSFANEIGALAGDLGADADAVMDIFCQDQHLNLSAAYLRPGMPFGGSCLPKDLRAATYNASRRDLGVPLLDAVLRSNAEHTKRCIDRILSHGRKRVGVFGLSFKAGTDDLRESPVVDIIETLLGKGVEVSIYDNRVSLAKLIGTNKEYIARHLPHVATLLKGDMQEVLDSSDVLVIANKDPEFLGIPSLMRSDQVLIDLAGLPAGVPAAEKRSA